MSKSNKSKRQRETIGTYIGNLPTGRKIAQRELARRIGIFASYLNDIEKDTRPASQGELGETLAQAPATNPETTNDLAGLTKNTLPPDVTEFFHNKLEVFPLMRMNNA